MKIYGKILLATLPLLLIAFALAGGITFYLSRAALQDIAEQWLETRSLEALRAAQEQAEFLEAYGLGTIEASVAQAQGDAGAVMSQIDIGEEGYVFVVDGGGRLIQAPDSSLIGPIPAPLPIN